MSLDDELARELALIQERGLGRQLRAVEGPQGPRIRLDGTDVLNFSSNNYLGLADHPALLGAALASLQGEGIGAGAARLIVGNFPSHRRLERALATFHETEAALLFSSGYQANLGVLAALAGPEDVLFSDALNHASIIDGCRLSRATVLVYRHGDLEHLATMLRTARGRRRFIVSDTIFSMDGDVAPLAGLRSLASEHGASLLVDEAHATGVLGPSGRGHAAAVGVRADVHIATLGKALGTSGAYVAGSRFLVDYLLHRARTFVFTTAAPPSIAAATIVALELAAGQEGEQRRARLRENIAAFAEGLATRRLLAAGAGQTPIFPLLVGDERRALDLTTRLLARGIYAQAIRPPTVPPGGSRLRFALMATHTRSDIDRVLAALDELLSAGLLHAP